MKKLLIFCLALVLAIGTVVTGTVAYLQDEEYVTNVAVVGNVDVEQLEMQRAEGIAYNKYLEEGDLIPYVQGQKLYPAYPKKSVEEGAYEAGQAEEDCMRWGSYVTADVAEGSSAWNGLWDEEKLVGVMDKMVFVKNTGTADCYYRTWLAFECPDNVKYGLVYNDADITWNVNGSTKYFNWTEEEYAVINGVRYMITCATYLQPLAEGEISRPSLLQVAMTHLADNDVVKAMGDTYEILAYTQAMQTVNFEEVGPAVALSTAFGDEHPWGNEEDGWKGLDNNPFTTDTWDGSMDQAWFDVEKAAAATEENPVVFEVDTAEEFAGFVNLANTNSFKNVTVKLTKDLDMGGQNWNTGGSIAAYGSAFNGTLDGDGHTIRNLTAENSWSYANALFRTIGNDATFKNLVFEDVNINNAAGSGNNKEYAILVGIVGGGTVNFENITFRNCSVTAKTSAGLLVGGMTEGAIYVKNCKVEDSHVKVTNENTDTTSGAAFLGNGWSHHNYDYAGVFVENSPIGSECTLTTGDGTVHALPDYNYVK